MLSNNAVLIVWFFDLHEGQGHTIEQKNNVRTEFDIAISVGQFCIPAD